MKNTAATEKSPVIGMSEVESKIENEIMLRIYDAKREYRASRADSETTIAVLGAYDNILTCLPITDHRREIHGFIASTISSIVEFERKITEERRGGI